MRAIISEQLGTEVDKVGAVDCWVIGDRARIAFFFAGTPLPPDLQASFTPYHCSQFNNQKVAPAAKFVDLGADSLDTVRVACVCCGFGAGGWVALKKERASHQGSLNPRTPQQHKPPYTHNNTRQPGRDHDGARGEV